MPAGTTGAATIRHVGLVALEALLVAMIIWVTTMALAGATQVDGLIGSATAGGAAGTLAVDARSTTGGVLVTSDPATGGAWVHVACRSGVASVTASASQWSRIGGDRRVSIGLAAVARPMTCVAEQGYFSANGKWRVLAATTFTVGG